MRKPRRFLTAEWRNLAMLNYVVDRRLLEPLVPAGTDLDEFAGQAFVSIVGFMFLRTRVLGIGVPGYRDFPEVNLRFYVRRRAPEGWRRGVVFVKELVPQRLTAWLARALYNENYHAVPLRAEIMAEDAGMRCTQCAYRWRHRGTDHAVTLAVDGVPQTIQPGSVEEFITEHYWGYSRQRDGSTLEYRVEHPPWRVQRSTEARYCGDAGTLYGEAFSELLQGAPHSAFLAEGSAIAVYRGDRIVS